MNRSAIVIGGSRGIGAAIVECLAQSGIAVAFTFAASSGEAEALVSTVAARGGQVRAVRADCADVEGLTEALTEIVSTFGTLDILICCAGVMIADPDIELSLATFDQMANINIKSYIAAVKCVLNRMSHGGRIVMIGSVAGTSSRFAGSTFYALTKAALGGLVRGLARDLGPRAITVNLVQPGPIGTELVKSSELANTLRELTCLGRLGTPQEVASLVDYLVRPDAGFITGASLVIDGGYLA